MIRKSGIWGIHRRTSRAQAHRMGGGLGGKGGGGVLANSNAGVGCKVLRLLSTIHGCVLVLMGRKLPGNSVSDLAASSQASPRWRTVRTRVRRQIQGWYQWLNSIGYSCLFLSMVFCLRTVEGCACASAHVRARRGFTVDPYQAILSTSLIFEH